MAAAMGAEDAAYVLHRALLLQSQLLARVPRLARSGTLDIDPGVLQAFLEVPTCVHGARSLEAVVEMSSLAGRLRYERSALPARHQLALHVDAEAFLGLVNARPTPREGHGGRLGWSKRTGRRSLSTRDKRDSSSSGRLQET
jgi:hypothetical protein